MQQWLQFSPYMHILKKKKRLKCFFAIYSLTCTIHFGLIFKMGDQVLEIRQLALNSSKTSGGPSLPASVSSLLRKKLFAAGRGKGKADLGTLE